MARKFNAGRQGEYLMNSQLFDVYNALKYINYKNVTPTQDKQAEIPDGALWVDTSQGTNILKRYIAASHDWIPMFEGYFQPLPITENPVNPSDGQIWIDPSGVIRYYDKQTAKWNVAAARSAANANISTAGIPNFYITPELKSSFTDTYPVSNVSIGKLFRYDSPESGRGSYVDGSQYEDINTVAVYYPNSAKYDLAWCNVNPVRLSGCTKRLIKVINTEPGDDQYFVETTTTNTEFYGFKEGDITGTFLRSRELVYGSEDISSEKMASIIASDTISDYVRVTGGIKLINKGKNYKYIYAITYHFADSAEKNDGVVLSNGTTIGEINEIEIGDINDNNPTLFLDGIYLEQKEYSYDKTTGMMKFNGDGITNRMSMVAVSFTHTLCESIGDNDIIFSNTEIVDNDIVIHNSSALANIDSWTTPIAFVSGVAGFEQISDQVTIDKTTNSITVKDFGPVLEDESYSIMLVDIGSETYDHGTATKNVITSDIIVSDTSVKYLLFIDGVCMSPKDLVVSNGQITISGDLSNDVEWFLIRISNTDTGIYLMFDEDVSYYTTMITDHNNNTIYNNADMVVAYSKKQDSKTYGVLIDDKFITDTPDGLTKYVTGQVLNMGYEDELGDIQYAYHIYNSDGTYTWKKYDDVYGKNSYLEVDDMVTQYATEGSLSIMSNKGLVGSNLYYYAYTYADTIDEPIRMGNRTCKINSSETPVVGNTQAFYTNKNEVFLHGKGCIAAYVNGIMQEVSDTTTMATCEFIISTTVADPYKQKWGKQEELYAMLKAFDDTVTLGNLKQFMVDNGVTSLAASEDVYNKIKVLHDAITEYESENSLCYIFEEIEAEESYSANRLTADASMRYDIFPNTYIFENYSIGAGTINVYLNGVFLEKSCYSIFDGNKIMINNIDTVGGSDQWTKDGDHYTDMKYYDESDGTVKWIECGECDYVTLEFRPDNSVKKVTYDVKQISYDTQSFDTEDYEFPSSLKNSKDLIKIYINGILYDGTYVFKDGVLSLNTPVLNMDPIELYFNSHPYEYKIWKNKNGEYIAPKDRVTFEWR